MLSPALLSALTAEIKDDPGARGYLTVYATVGPENGAEWNIFNMLRDPAWKVGDASEQGLVALGIVEQVMTIADVRLAILAARA